MQIIASKAGLADRIPPHFFFAGSAVFHYLGPAFAVLLFARVAVPGVAWLRIVSAGVIFALWRRPWRAFLGGPAESRQLIVYLGIVLAVMNLAFYEAILDAGLEDARINLEGFQGPGDAVCCSQIVKREHSPSVTLETFGTIGDGLDVVDTGDLNLIGALGGSGSRGFLVDSINDCGGNPSLGCAIIPVCDSTPDDESLLASTGNWFKSARRSHATYSPGFKEAWMGRPTTCPSEVCPPSPRLRRVYK